jgi:hypothetical protein
MEPLNSTACDDIIDEWGKFVKEEDIFMCMETNGVLDGIRQNNPAITAVEVDSVDYYDANIVWAAAGNGIGSNRYLRFLCVRAGRLTDLEDVQAFFGGLALNRSIQALRIILEYPDDDGDDYIPSTKTIFENLLRWFQFNDNLQVFDFECDEHEHPSSML